MGTFIEDYIDGTEPMFSGSFWRDGCSSFMWKTKEAAEKSRIAYSIRCMLEPSVIFHLVPLLALCGFPAYHTAAALKISETMASSALLSFYANCGIGKLTETEIVSQALYSAECSGLFVDYFINKVEPIPLSKLKELALDDREIA